jgi:peptide/nickel transport system permease protein
MAGYIFGRVIGGIVTLICVSALAFFATALAPGNPAAVLLGNMATPERVEAVNKLMGLDQPLPVRYGIWLKEVLKGNLGTSNLSFRPVVGLIGSALPATLELAALSLLVTVLISIPLGLLMAQKQQSWWTQPLSGFVTLGISVPGFWVGLLLVIVFSLWLHVLPSGGFVPFSRNPGGNLRSMVLPTLTLVIYLTPSLVRFVRVAAAAVLREDFVDTARAKGVGMGRIMLRHVAPNTLISTITYIGLQLGLLISGAIIVEVIFAIPGIGRLGMSAVLNRDYPVIQGVVLVAAAGYVLVNLLVDLAYSLIDPRVRIR